MTVRFEGLGALDGRSSVYTHGDGRWDDGVQHGCLRWVARRTGDECGRRSYERLLLAESVALGVSGAIGELERRAMRPAARRYG